MVLAFLRTAASVANPFFPFLRGIGAVLFLLTCLVPETRGEVPVVLVYEDQDGVGFFDPSPRAPVGGNAGTTLGEQRRIVFEAAVYQWSQYVSGTVPIEIRAIWNSQGEAVLATASPANYSRDWAGAPIEGRWYPVALANQLAGMDLVPADGANDGADIHVFCNADWDNGVNAANGDARPWYYGLDGNGPTDAFDFYSITLHELGHGLGFLSFLNEDGTWVNGAPTIYDHYLTNGVGLAVAGMDRTSRASMNTSGDLFVGGPALRGINGNARARIYAPANYEPGSSVSHFDEATYSGVGSLHELLTPISTRSAHDPGPLAIGLLRDLGYEFVDHAVPEVSISVPELDGSYHTLAKISGSATDLGTGGEEGAVGLREVRVALARRSDGSWYAWNSGGWETEFDFVRHVRKPTISLTPIATGQRPWHAQLPNLPDGAYELHVMAVDQLEQGSAWVAHAFRLDNTISPIDFSPWQNGDTVFSLEDIGGHLSSAADIRLIIAETGLPARYWNGTTGEWTTNRSEAGVALAGSSVNGRWRIDVNLPGRAQTRPGGYTLSVVATDDAGNENRAEITVQRSAIDTSLPEIAISSPEPDQVFEVRNLPAFTGTASDPESGIGEVGLVLLRLTENGFLSWNGMDWSEEITTLPALYDPLSQVWQSDFPMPNEEGLPNGQYQLQALARNREEPGATRGISVAFEVDYHPVFTWTGAVNSNWLDAYNWNPRRVPGPDAIVVMGGGVADATALGTLNLHQLKLNAGQLITQGFQVMKLNIAGGTLVTDVTNLHPDGGHFEWTGGTIRGTFGFLPGTSVNLSGPDRKSLGSGTRIHNYTTVTRDGTGDLYNYAYHLSDRAAWTNYAGARFVILGEGNIFANAYNDWTFLNESGASIVKTGSGVASLNQIALTNAGEIDVVSGEVNLSGTHFFEDGSRVSGAGTLRFTSGTLHLRGTTTIDGATFTQAAGTLSGDPEEGGKMATVSNGLIAWTGGYWSGKIQFLPGSQVHLHGDSTKSLGPGAVVENAGTVYWSEGNVDNYAYHEVQRATIINATGGTFLLSGATAMTYSYSPSTFRNAAGGAVIKIGGDDVPINWIFENAGEATTSGGSLIFGSGGKGGGRFQAGTNSRISFAGGDYVLDEGAIFAGPGQIRVAGGRVNRTTVLHTGTGDEAARILISSGSFGGTGEVTGEGVITWTGGAIDGTLDLTPDVILQLEGDSTKTLGSGAILNNRGLITRSGAGTIYNYAYHLAQRASLNNLDGGVFKIMSDGPLFSNAYNSSFFTNAPGGQIVKTGGEGEVAVTNFTFANSGEIRAENGTLRLQGTTSFHEGTHFSGSGRILFAGTIDADAPFSATAEIVLESGTLTALRNAEEEPVVVFEGPTPMEWTGGVLAGGFIVGADAALEIRGANTKSLGSGAILDNYGKISWQGPGRIHNSAYHLAQRATINNRSGGIFAVLGDGEIFAQDYNSSWFNNLAGALLVKEAGNEAAIIRAFILTNHGDVRVEQGALRVEGDFNINDGSRFAGSGQVRINGKTNLSGLASVEEGQLILDSGSLTGVSETSATLATVDVGRFIWTGGAIGGVVGFAPGAEVLIEGADTKTFLSGAILNNAGNITWTEGNLHNHAYQLVSRATIHNLGGGRFAAAGAGAITFDYNPSFFRNHPGATFEKAGSQTLTTSHWNFINEGSLHIAGGGLLFTQSLDLAESGTLAFAIRGTGADEDYGSLSVAGAFEPAGDLVAQPEDGFEPQIGDRFTLVKFGSRTGEFGSAGISGLGPELSVAREYEPKAFSLAVISVPTPPKISQIRWLPEGGVSVTVTGLSGSAVRLETSLDLVTWVPVKTITPFSGSVEMIDDTAGSSDSRRFYRAVIEF